MKTKNSIKNSIAAMFANLVTILIGFIAQAMFINILGTEYLGINGLFSNIISMLGIVELGIGSAIIYNLYKPMEEKNIETIKSLMNFYKKAYNIIALIVLIIGIILIPFLHFFIEKITVDINIQIVYILFIIDIVCSYLFSYKRSILYADQKNYIINIVHMAYLIILNISQLIVLYITKNYYIYLIVKVLMRIIENNIITFIVNKKYKYLKQGKAKKLDSEIGKDILKKVKALFLHKIGYFLVLGTDNIIISKFLGIVTVGLYSNYFLVINAVQTLFGQAITAITPSVGHMLVEGDKKKNYEIFKKVRFINFWISTFTAISILIIIQPFIILWIGEKYLLSNIVLYLLVFNYFQKIMRSSYNTFKEAGGIYYEDRFVPLIESALNIIFSIIFVKLLGLSGVILGTILSDFVIWFYSFPKFIYKNLFRENYWKYTKETIGYILIFIIISIITYTISNIIVVDSNILKIIINCIIAIIIPNFIILVIFIKTDNIKYIKNLLITKNGK